MCTYIIFVTIYMYIIAYTARHSTQYAQVYVWPTTLYIYMVHRKVPHLFPKENNFVVKVSNVPPPQSSELTSFLFNQDVCILCLHGSNCMYVNVA